MRKFILIGLSAFALFTTCKKSQIVSSNGCISMALPKYVTGPDSVAATTLFKNNNIDFSTLRYVNVVLNDTIKTGVNQGANQIVFAVKYYNGLPDLTFDYDYHFINGALHDIWPAPVASISASPVVNLTLQAVRQAYINAAVANHVVQNVADSCLVAQAGYYDINLSTTATAQHKYVTAWYVKPAHSFYPQAIILDADGSAFSFEASGPVLNYGPILN